MGDKMIQRRDLHCVGTYLAAFNELTQQTLPVGRIYQADGLAVHVRKHHPDSVENLSHVQTVIAAPDYVGKHPKETNSVELVKTISDHVMVCVKLDEKNGYLYVASVYCISSGKLEKRLRSGRLKNFAERIDKQIEL